MGEDVEFVVFGGEGGVVDDFVVEWDDGGEFCDFEFV